MNMLMASLGLDQVEADVNKMPDGRYDGVISESAYVFVESKNEISHVLTYRVTDGTEKGKSKQEWFKIGNECKDENGNTPSKFSEIKGFTPAMTEQAKPWYKKRLVDLGVEESAIPTLDVETLVDTPVTFGVKSKDGYQNINYAEKRVASGTAPTAAVSLSAPAGLAPASVTGSL